MPNGIYSSAESAQIGYEEAKRNAEHANFGIELDILGTDPSIKDYFAPLLPWEICAVQAQTSNGKSMFTNFWERQVVKQLNRQGRDEAIVHVSLEESVEAMAFQDYGRILHQRPADFASGKFTEWARMEWAKNIIDGVPIWRVADSSRRPENAPELTLSNIYRLIRELTSGRLSDDEKPVKLALITVDYLQVLPIDPEVKKQALGDAQRRLQVAQDVDRLRKMTTFLQAPILVPLQSKQELKGNNPPMMIPGVYDGFETSYIATRFDRMISLWMPKTTNPVGTIVSKKGTDINFVVKEDQAFLKVSKQRGGLPAGRVWELRVDYDSQDYFDVYYKDPSSKKGLGPNFGKGL
jgi:hypothetical protein